MPSLNSNDVSITISTSADTKGVKDAQKSITDLGNESEGSSKKGGLLSGAFANFGKTIALVGGAFAAYKIVDQITNFGSTALRSAADLQQVSKSYEVLTGNVQVANKLFAQLAQYANTTPFEFPEISKAGQTLLGFGISSDRVYDRVKQLGDIAAATGADFQSLAVVYGQVNAAGRLYGQDALQLINNSVPVYNILAKQMGISVKDVREKMEQGAITADIFNKALQATTEQGGFAFKGVDTLAKSFNGRMSTLKDTVTDFGRQLLGVKIDPELGLTVQPGGLFDLMSRGVQSITSSLSGLAPQAGGAMTQAIQGIQALFTGFEQGNGTLEGFQGSMQHIGFVIRQAWDIIVGMFGPSLEALWNTLTQKLGPSLERLLPTLQILAQFVGVLVVAAIWVVINVINVLAERLSAIINVIANVAQWFVNSWNFISSIWQRAPDFFRWIAGAISGAVAGVFDAISGPFRSAFEYIRGIPDRIVGVFSGLGKRVSGAIGSIGGGASALLSKIPGFAVGGYTGAGATNEPAGIVHKGEYVVPKSQVDQNTGMPKMGNTVTNHIYVTLSSAGAVKEMFNQLNDDGIIVGMGLTPKQGAY